MLLCERGYHQMSRVDSIIGHLGYLHDGERYSDIQLGKLFLEIDAMSKPELDELNIATKAFLDLVGMPYGDLEPGYIDPIEERRIDRVGKLWRSKAHVDVFKRRMKDIAFERLDANAHELDAIQRHY